MRDKEKKRASDAAYRLANAESVASYQKTWQTAHKADQRAKKQAKYRADPKAARAKVKEWIELNPSFTLLRNARRRAKDLNLPFNITKADILIPDTCPILGIPIRIGKGKPGPHSPTLDRISPRLGYVRGNVAVISLRANSIKGAITPEIILRLAAYVAQNRN